MKGPYIGIRLRCWNTFSGFGVSCRGSEEIAPVILLKAPINVLPPCRSPNRDKRGLNKKKQ